MKDKANLTFWIMMLINLLIITFSVKQMINYYDKENPNLKLSPKEITEINQCSGMDIQSSVFCIKNFISGFYNYTIRDEFLYKSGEGTLEDVKLNGGDCYDYTNIYISSAKELGFLSKRMDLYSEDKTFGHTFAIIYDKNLSAYCKADLLTINCFEFKR